MKRTFEIKCDRDANEMWERILNFSFENKYPYYITIMSEEEKKKDDKKKRTLLQNNTFHGWMQQIAEAYNDHRQEGQNEVTAKAWKVHFKRLFLGYETIETIDGFEDVLIETHQLGTKAMAEFMDKVKNWVGLNMAEYNLILRTKDDLLWSEMSEYGINLDRLKNE
jgi:hypothetical protein